MSETTKNAPNHHFIHSSQIFWIYPTQPSHNFHFTSSNWPSTDRINIIAMDNKDTFTHFLQYLSTVASPPDRTLLSTQELATRNILDHHQSSQDSVSSDTQRYANNVPESPPLIHIVPQVQEQLQQQQTANQQALNQDSLFLTVDSQDMSNQGPSLKELEQRWQDRNMKLKRMLYVVARSFPSILVWMFLSFLLTGITILATQWSNKGLKVFGFILAVPSALFLLLSVLLYYYECFYCYTRQVLLFLSPGVNVTNYVAQLKEAIPYMLVRVECYHMENKSRVVTFTNSQKVPFKTVVDTSLDFEPKSPRGHKYLMLQLTEEIICDDEYSVQFISETKNQAERMNRFRDECITVETEFCIDGYRPQLMFDVLPERLSFMVGLGWFWLFSVLGLTVLYRHLVDNQSRGQYYTIQKGVSF